MDQSQLSIAGVPIGTDPRSVQLAKEIPLPEKQVRQWNIFEDTK